jgi:hypothetical protein
MTAAGMLLGTLLTLFVLPVFYLPFRKAASLNDDRNGGPSRTVSTVTP